MDKCPCGNNAAYEQCCQPFIKGKAKPVTAEQLMRSRYSAYSKGKVNYIKQTMKKPALKHFDAKRFKMSAEKTTWLGLEIKSTKQGLVDDEVGWVEFVAIYRDQTGLHELHELSEFIKVGGCWYYVDGKHSL